MNAHNHSDDPYAESEQLWSGNPNDALIREVQGLAVGDAVDVGAGEGADAVWLAKQGWVTTAVEPSAIACDRIAEAATKAAVQVTIMQETLVGAELGTYDLVSAFYMPLTPNTVPVLCDAVAPGGTLLFVHHKDMPHKDILGPADLAEALPSDFTVDKLTTTSRSVTGGAGVEHTADVVLLARRSL